MKALFKLIDCTASILMGIGTAFLVSLIIGQGWNMFLAMITGMVLGIVVLLMTVIIFSGLSTFFQVMPVGVVITMTAGTASGLALSATTIDLEWLFLAAVGLSLTAQSVLELYNLKLGGDVPVDGDE